MYSKLIIGTIALVITGATGFYYGKGNKEIERVEVKGETKIEYRDRVVVHEVIKTVQPDGTVTETTREIVREVEQNTSETTSSNSEVIKSNVSKYSLGLYAGPAILSKQGLSDYDYKKDWQVEGGMRIMGPVWGSVIASPFNRSLALGVRVEL